MTGALTVAVTAWVTAANSSPLVGTSRSTTAAATGGAAGTLSAVHVLAAAFGALVCLGLLLVVLGARRAPATSGRPGRHRLGRLHPASSSVTGSGATSAATSAANPTTRSDRRLTAASAAVKRSRTRGLLGLAAGIAVWALSGWAVAVLVLPAAAVGLPMLLAKSDTDAGVRRLEALEEWTRHLAGVLDVGVGLEQAIMVNLRSTPTAIRPQVQTLVARLSARWPTELALRAFADDLDDSTGDLVAASLLLGARRRGAGLTRVLQGLAETVADEVRMRREVEADRAKPRTTARAVTLITLGVLGLLAFNTTYISPYGTPEGQLVLVLLLGSYAAALVWMRLITRGRATPRFLPPTSASTSAASSATAATPSARPLSVASASTSRPAPESASTMGVV